MKTLKQFLTEGVDWNMIGISDKSIKSLENKNIDASDFRLVEFGRIPVSFSKMFTMAKGFSDRVFAWKNNSNIAIFQLKSDSLDDNKKEALRRVFGKNDHNVIAYQINKNGDIINTITIPSTMNSIKEGMQHEIKIGNNYVQNGDLADFGNAGELYVADVAYDANNFWVTDDEKDRFNKKASGWTIKKSLLKKVIDDDQIH